jgi:hypothetical protein
MYGSSRPRGGAAHLETLPLPVVIAMVTRRRVSPVTLRVGFGNWAPHYFDYLYVAFT